MSNLRSSKTFVFLLKIVFFYCEDSEPLSKMFNGVDLAERSAIKFLKYDNRPKKDLSF